MLRAGAVEGGERRIAAEPHAVALGVDGQRVLGKGPAHDQREPGEQPLRRVLVGCVAECGAAVAGQGEADGGMAHGEPVDRVGGVARFGARRLEELEPRRRRVEEVRHRDGGPGRARRRRARAHRAARSLDRPRILRAGRAAGQREPADGGDGGQRLAAETERPDRPQIAVPGELGGGVAGERERQLVARHAAPVVGDTDEAAAALLQRHLDGPRARVDRVLDQLFDHRRRTLDYLAGGDPVDRALRQQTYRHGPASRWRRTSPLPCSTAGWSNGATPSRCAATTVSSMKCIIRAPRACASAAGTPSRRTGRPAPVAREHRPPAGGSHSRARRLGQQPLERIARGAAGADGLGEARGRILLHGQ